MPRLKTLYVCNSVTLLRWKLTESWQELLGRCQAARMEIDIDNLPKSDKRRCEVLAEHLLLSWCLMDRKVRIEHDEHGVPRLARHDDIYVSISHTRGMVMVALSPCEPVGIDVECISDRVVKVRSKFVNDSESDNISAVDETDLTLAWTAKEAMYKLAGVPGASLRDDFTIRSMVFTKAGDTHSLWAHSTATGERQDIEICSLIDREEKQVTTIALFFHSISERSDRDYIYSPEE